MKILNKIFLFFYFISITSVALAYEVNADGIVLPTNPPRLVNDFINLLTTEQQAEIENELVDYYVSTSTQICVVIIDTLQGKNIEDYALQVGRSWGIGQKDKDNGVLLLISKNDRKVDIEVGYGLEAHLTDYACRSIIQTSIVPNFKENNYYLGIKSAIYRIKSFLDAEPITADYTYSLPQTKENWFEKYGYWLIVLIVFAIPLFVGFYFGIKHGFKGTISASSGGWSSSSSSSYSSSSSSNSSSSSSRSFGGFGGGSFGGGGSSGSW